MTYTKGRMIKDGGEGYIHEVEGHPNLLMKIYKERDAQGDPIVTPALHSKLRYMKDHPPANLVNLGQIAWPIELQYDASGKFLGFVMPRLSFDYQIQKIYGYRHPLLDHEEYQEGPAFKSKVGIAINLCSIINELHSAGYVVGDLNHENIGINGKTGAVNIVDCDSFHITDESGQVLRTNVIMPGYLAPEVIKHCNAERASGRPHNLDKVALPTFTKETDLFCLAIHIFKLLMNGVDPFRGVNVNITGSNASPFIGNEAIERNAYVFRENNRPSATFCPPKNSLPTEISSLFDLAFLGGINNTKVRPTAEDWYRALRVYYDSLADCPDNHKHHFYNGLPDCPLCKSDKDYLAEQDPRAVEISTKSIRTTATATATPVQSGPTASTYTPLPQKKKSNAWKWWVTAAAVLLAVGIPLFVNYYNNNIYASYVRLTDNSEYNVLFVGGEQVAVQYDRDYPTFDKDSFNLVSNNTSAATIDSGYYIDYLRAESDGVATISVQSNNTGISDSDVWYAFKWKDDDAIQINRGDTEKLYGYLDVNTRKAFNEAHDSMQIYDILPELVKFISSDSNVVSVDDYGNVTAKAKGNAQVTVSQGGNVLQTYAFNAVVKAEDIAINKTEVNLKLGERFQLTATVIPGDSDDSMAFSGSLVSANGLITAPASGSSSSGWTDQVTVTAGDVTKQVTVNITNPSYVSAINLNTTDITLEMGETFQLVAKLTPSDSNAEITYSGAGIAVTNAGKITAPSYGDGWADTYAITVSAGNVSKSIDVHVRNSYNWHWYDGDYRINNVATSDMVFDKSIPDCTGFRLGIKLKNGDKGSWNIYTYSGKGGAVTEQNKVGTIKVSGLNEWYYADIKFSKRDVYWILIRPPVNDRGGWNGWNIWTELSKINYSGYVH